MSILKRLSTSVSAKFETLVSQIEDHDAVAESVIGDIRKEVARARVRLMRLKSDGKQNRHLLEQNQVQQRQWKQRALEVASTNEVKALQCLSRARDCEQQIEHYEKVVAEHELIESRLEKDIASTERRLAQVSRQRNQIRTRQASAESMAAISRLDHRDHGPLNNVFERWEQVVTEAELASGHGPLETGSLETTDSTDHFEKEFITAEKTASLQSELEFLVKENQHEQ